MKFIAKTLIISILSFVIILFALFPIFWLLRLSFMYPADALALPPKIFFIPTLSNYHYIIYNCNFIKFFLNSILISIGSVTLSLFLGTPAAYALSRFNLRRKNDIQFYFLSARMGLPVVALIAFFIQFHALNLLDTYIALIIAHQTFNLPLVIWITKSFIDAMPTDIEEASLLDGCSKLGSLLRITLPVIAPGLITTAILAFIFSFNDFIFAAILTSYNARTATVFIYGFFSPERGLEWNYISAGAMLLIIPILIFSLLVQKYLIRGLTFGMV